MLANAIPRTWDEKLALSRRVAVGAYYADGRALHEVIDVNSRSVGCITIQDVISNHIRCLGIEDFRASLWLVRS